MRILWLSHFVPYPAKGGLLIRSYNLLKAVSSEHNVHLVCLIQPRLLKAYYPTLEDGLKAAKSHFKNQLNIECVDFFILPSEKSKLNRLFCLAKSLLANSAYSVDWLKCTDYQTHTRNLIENKEFDAIHVDTMGLMQMLPLGQIKPKVIVNHHNAEHHMMLRRSKNQKNLLKKAIFYLEGKKIECFDKINITRTNCNIVCSKIDGQRVAELATKNLNIHIIPNGVPYKPKAERRPIRGKLLFVGGLDWYPNRAAISHFLTNIWPHIRLVAPNITLDIIGKNPSKNILNLSEKFPEVTIHGYVEDINKFYSEAMLFVCPIYDGGGTKLKVLDAMNNGIPVLGTACAFEGIDIKNGFNALMVETDSDYKKLIMSMMNDKISNIEISQESRKLIEAQYDSNKIGKEYSSLINNITKY